MIQAVRCMVCVWVGRRKLRLHATCPHCAGPLLPRGSGATGVTPPAQCELCEKVAELRPYGPRGEKICVACARKNVELTERQMSRVLFGEAVN